MTNDNAVTARISAEALAELRRIRGYIQTTWPLLEAKHDAFEQFPCQECANKLTTTVDGLIREWSQQPEAQPTETPDGR